MGKIRIAVTGAGAIGQAQAACARSWEQTSQENKAYASYDYEDCYVISGTFGSLSVPALRLKTYGRSEDADHYVFGAISLPCGSRLMAAAMTARGGNHLRPV